MEFQLYNQLGVMHGGNECRLSHDNRSSMIWKQSIWGINGGNIRNSLISPFLSIVAQQ